ncbi:hypothetical protein ISX50_15345 [Vibrio cyclitrophicus]|nr:hypothetical protein [Vibrio cyclitrophicus]UPR34423.1 hypothetical protein ISX50_15345 [Vibrio cyclitrophicus]
MNIYSSSIFIIALASSAAYSADVTYSGPYSQLNVKLCSDTPPSRSLLPSGSMVCEVDPPSFDTMCTASWDYAPTDIFNCATTNNSDDINNNGIPDGEEDFDGDGIINSEDATPYTHDEKIPVVDLNNNGIPDNLEPFYDKLNTNTPTVVNCDNSDGECTRYSSSIRELAINNRELAKIIANSSISGVSASTLDSQVQRLMAHETERAAFTSHRVDLLDAHLDYNLDAVNDNVWDLNQTVFKQNRKFSEIQTTLDDHSKEYLQHFNNLNRVTDSNRSLNQDIYLATNDIKSDIAELQNSGSGGLTNLQKTQLKNAAKANANQKLIKTLLGDVGSLTSDVASLQGNFGSIDGKFAQVDGQFAALDGKFAQVNSNFTSVNGNLSQAIYKIDKLSSDGVDVDLTGVEGSISALSDKIDGLELGGDNSALEGKIDNLIGAVTNDKPFSVSSSGFTGEGFLFNQHELSELQEDVTEIKQEVTQELDKFKTLFSIDTSSFNNGTFKEHSLNLRVNGSEQSFKSGVFTALLDNAAIISAVIMFLFVLSGIRMLGKD